MCKVLNQHHPSTKKRYPNAVYVGRPSKWGNPFIIGTHGSRDEVVDKYEQYLLSNPKLLASLHTLKGKDLICWCAPYACHADILLKYANASTNLGPLSR